jgi:Cd2+/Zn2+-exporting ATPase
LLRLAAAVEQTSEHHLARAVATAAAERGIDVPLADDFISHPGEGVAAMVDGLSIWVGNAAMAERRHASIAPLLRGWAAAHTSLGRSVVYVGVGDVVEGAMSFGDELKPNVAAAVRHLKYEGVRWITVLSGDHPDAVRAIAAEIGADEVRAGLLPHEKVDAVRVLRQSSAGVAMVGDGVNDAPAMAAATIGIAMGAIGTDVAIETADVVLMSDDVEKVDYVIHLGKRARRVVRQNVYFSLAWMAMLVVVALTSAFRCRSPWWGTRGTHCWLRPTGCVYCGAHRTANRSALRTPARPVLVNRCRPGPSGSCRDGLGRCAWTRAVIDDGAAY